MTWSGVFVGQTAWPESTRSFTSRYQSSRSLMPSPRIAVWSCTRPGPLPRPTSGGRGLGGDAGLDRVLILRILDGRAPGVCAKAGQDDGRDCLDLLNSYVDPGRVTWGASRTIRSRGPSSVGDEQRVTLVARYPRQLVGMACGADPVHVRCQASVVLTVWRWQPLGR
jgi:hypothetical protein